MVILIIMFEYRIDFNESKLGSFIVAQNVISALRERGDVREVISETKYY
jgi:hypothetical protein